MEERTTLNFKTTYKLTLQVDDSTPDHKCPQEIAATMSTYIYIYPSYFTLGLSAIFRRRVGSRILLMR